MLQSVCKIDISSSIKTDQTPLEAAQWNLWQNEMDKNLNAVIFIYFMSNSIIIYILWCLLMS